MVASDVEKGENKCLTALLESPLTSAAVQCEVAVSINGGDIVHINGPFRAGLWPHISIFWSCLIYKLYHGKMVEADCAYRVQLNCLLPVDYATPLEKAQKNKACASQETVNWRFKQFGALGNCFQHHVSWNNMSLYQAVFETVVVVAQLDINNGNNLFHVDFTSFDCRPSSLGLFGLMASHRVHHYLAVAALKTLK